MIVRNETLTGNGIPETVESCLELLCNQGIVLRSSFDCFPRK